MPIQRSKTIMAERIVITKLNINRIELKIDLFLSYNIFVDHHIITSCARTCSLYLTFSTSDTGGVEQTETINSTQSHKRLKV